MDQNLRSIFLDLSGELEGGDIEKGTESEIDNLIIVALPDFWTFHLF